MENIKFRVKEEETYTIVRFELPEPITPNILPKLTPPKINHTKGIILSGRGPIWLYGFLVHHYHPTKFIAIHDPRIGAIVVLSHTPELKIGDVIINQES